MFLEAGKVVKKRLQTSVFFVNIPNFMNAYLEKHLQTTASETHLLIRLFLKILLCRNMLSQRI